MEWRLPSRFRPAHRWRHDSGPCGRDHTMGSVFITDTMPRSSMDGAFPSVLLLPCSAKLHAGILHSQGHAVPSTNPARNGPSDESDVNKTALRSVFFRRPFALDQRPTAWWLRPAGEDPIRKSTFITINPFHHENGIKVHLRSIQGSVQCGSCRGTLHRSPPGGFHPGLAVHLSWRGRPNGRPLLLLSYMLYQFQYES